MSKTKEEIEKAIEKESEGRYPVATHSNPDNSPYIASQKTFKHGCYFGYSLASQQTSELKAENDGLRGLIKIEMDANENCRAELQRLTTTLSLIRPLAFADHSSVEYNMEEIRKILNNQK